MRTALAVICCLASTAPALGQARDIPERFGVAAIPNNYPQTTPKETLNSMLRALQRQRYDYLAAHLIEPAFVNAQVNENNLTFDRVVAEIRETIGGDPEDLKQLRQLARDGAIDIQGEEATVTLDTLPARKIFLRKVGERWFLENRNR